MALAVLMFFSIMSFLLRLACQRNDKYEFIPIKEREKLLFAKPDIEPYEKIVEEVRFENLNMIGEVKPFGISAPTTKERLYGMVLRVWRFRNISRKVEKKYGLPENVLLAMIMQETGGADLLPNSRDDGGIGLCHMQPSTASQFGLKTYENCKKLRCVKHGKALRKLIEENNQDRKLLVKYDDRFNPVLNIDAAGRMLAYYMSGNKVKSTYLQTGIYGYAGSVNYKKYYKNVMYYIKKLNDKTVLKKVEDLFNERNKNLIINGKKADFDDYIKAHYEMNRNYGLDEYE